MTGVELHNQGNEPGEWFRIVHVLSGYPMYYVSQPPVSRAYRPFFNIYQIQSSTTLTSKLTKL